MPAPTVGPQLVGKNAVITVGGTAIRHAGGTLNVGGGRDTVTYPNGYDHHASTNINASGELRLIVEYGEAVPIAPRSYDILVIQDGSFEQFNGEVYFEAVNQEFANDTGWTFRVPFFSHGEFGAGDAVSP